jgi:hypothetical protein
MRNARNSSAIAVAGHSSPAETQLAAAETAIYDFLDDWAEVRRAVADLGLQDP